MARTSAAAALSEQHRQLQLRVGASALQDFSQLWPLWQGDEQTFWRLVAATVQIVDRHRRMSGALGENYFTTFRALERVHGRATAAPAAPLDENALRASMVVTGLQQTDSALAAGQRPAEAMKTALVRTAGTVTRFVYDGGRSSILDSVKHDDVALGWARVTSGKPCAFCAMLASRGPSYKSETTADFRAHDHCACMAEPFYPGADWPGRALDYRALWNQHAKGDSPLNAFRQALAGQAG